METRSRLSSGVGALQEEWRERVRTMMGAPRADATAWAIINLLPAHPMISAPVAAAVTARARSRVYEAIDQLVGGGVLLPLSDGKRNRWWEAAGLLDLIARLEAGGATRTGSLRARVAPALQRCKVQLPSEGTELRRVPWTPTSGVFSGSEVTHGGTTAPSSFPMAGGIKLKQPISAPAAQLLRVTSVPLALVSEG